MSGEVVVAPAVPLVLVALPLVALGVAVHAQLQEQRAAAAQREKERLEIWQRHLVRQSRAMQQLNDEWRAMETLRQGLAASRLVEPPPRDEPSADAGALKPRGVPPVSEEGRMRAVLVSVEDLLAGLPLAVSQQRGAPFTRLRQQAQDWLVRMGGGHRSTPADLAAVLSFQDTVRRTVATWSRDLEEAAQGKRRLLERTERLLDEVLYCLQQDGDGDMEVRQLWSRLNALLRDDDITPGTLAWMEQRLAALKANMEQRLPAKHVRPVLQSRLRHHLGALGYQVLNDFPESGDASPSRAVLEIPGGECVEVTVHPDGRMAFAVRHQRRAKSVLPLSEAETEHFRAQEAIWCRDMRELVRRLVEEGWPFEIPFERQIPTASIAVLETPDDWESASDLENEEDRRVFHETPRQRHLP